MIIIDTKFHGFESICRLPWLEKIKHFPSQVAAVPWHFEGLTSHWRCLFRKTEKKKKNLPQYFINYRRGQEARDSRDEGILIHIYTLSVCVFPPYECRVWVFKINLRSHKLKKKNNTLLLCVNTCYFLKTNCQLFYSKICGFFFFYHARLHFHVLLWIDCIQFCVFLICLLNFSPLLIQS